MHLLDEVKYLNAIPSLQYFLFSQDKGPCGEYDKPSTGFGKQTQFDLDMLTVSRVRDNKPFAYNYHLVCPYN
jgi:hypothetical protein